MPDDNLHYCDNNCYHKEADVTRQLDLTEVDVLIIGAGISGIGAGCHLRRQCPNQSLVIIEARADLGGTWDLFKYPGIRSDSDLFTFGYDFRPWKEDKAIADGASIKRYIEDTAREYALFPHIYFNHRVHDLNWSSSQQRWQVTIRSADGSECVVLARWVFNAAGYYRYDQGHRPDFPGEQDFNGLIVHPQQWPDDLNYTDKKVVVIGSGATAVTLVPAMAERAAHVTLLQRTPSYVLPVPESSVLSRKLKPLLGESLTFALVRRFNIAKQRWVYQFCQKHPQRARKFIRWLNKKVLPEGYPVDEHFNPPYNPWEQRLCAVPGGDLFKVISAQQASMVTDHIEQFTSTGITLRSGKQLDADIIVTATGLNLAPLGGLQPRIDGQPVSLSDCLVYKGMLLSGIPNLTIAVGYTSSSWTLKIGLLCEHFTRLLNYMTEHNYVTCLPQAEDGLTTEPLLNFGAGYVQRSLDLMPKQAARFPWSMSWNYTDDVKIFRQGKVNDPALLFSRRRAPEGAEHAR